MSDATRPRPRPRPKPKARVPNHVDQAPPEASSSTTINSSPPQIKVLDSDEMFMRNRKRTSKTWQKLEEINKETTKTRTSNSDNDDASGSPRSRKQQKKSDGRDIPRWQKDKNLVRMLSVDLSDSDPDEVQIIDSKSDGKRAQKRKRPRSRSRSITPPPALPLHHLLNARNIVRRALDAGVREASPTHHEADESTDTIILDPELAQIAKSINSQPHKSYTLGPNLSENPDTVTISVKWQPHPLNEAGKSAAWDFKIDMDDNFRELFEATAEEAKIFSDNLIMSYNGKRLFPSVTPQALKLWREAEFVACDKTTYEYLRTHSSTPSLLADMRDTATPFDIPSDAEASSPPKRQPESDAESDFEGDTFKLILRSSVSSNNITLTVRPTTKCGAIVKAYLKKAGLADQYAEVFRSTDGKKSIATAKKGGKGKGAAEKNPTLCVDGDKMDNDVEISEADLEDGDMVEVVGL